MGATVELVKSCLCPLCAKGTASKAIVNNEFVHVATSPGDITNYLEKFAVTGIRIGDIPVEDRPSFCRTLRPDFGRDKGWTKELPRIDPVFDRNK